MASPILPSTGLGSGVNINKIVETLVEADTGAKANQIKRQTANNTAMLSGVSSLKGALSAYQAAMKKLNNPDAPAFNAYTATSNNDTSIKATSNNTAVPGSYRVVVDSLATSSKVASQKFVGGATSTIPPGDLTIEQGGEVYTVTIGDDATLQSVRDSINEKLSDKGISANIINGEGGARLVFSSTATGENTDISVDGIDELKIGGKSAMVGDGAGFIEAKAANASLTIDGVKVSSKTNTVENAISGITLDLLKLDGTSATATITVGANKDGLKASIQAYVDAYNTLVKTVNNLTAVTKDEKENNVLGPLSGDATTRSMLADLRTQLSTVGSGDRLTTLSQLGINTVRENGTLEFNSTKFDAAMKDKNLGPEVQELFTGTNGVFERMNKAVEPYISSGGILDQRNASLGKLQKQLSDQQLALDRRITTLTASLSKRYVAMDTLVGKLEAQRKNITSMFSALEAQQKNS